MKKAVVVLMLFIIATLSVVSVSACPTNIETTPYNAQMCYQTLSEGSVCVYGCDDAAGDVVIPSEIDGKSVGSIGQFAFSGNSNITSISIPDSVVSIKGYAFSDCQNIRGHVTIPESVRTLDPYAFGCGMSSVAIPGSTGWHYTTFTGCVNLETVYYGGTREQWAEHMKNPFPNDPENHWLKDIAKATVYYVYEDQNGDINFDGMTNILDAFTVYQSAAGAITLEWYEKAVADHNNDAALNMVDAAHVFQKSAGRI